MENISKLSFRGRKAFSEGMIRNYGKYGEYKKINGKWVRLKKGYPVFRKTLNYKKMKQFLILEKSYRERYFKDKSIKQLRKEIEMKFEKDYKKWRE